MVTTNVDGEELVKRAFGLLRDIESTLQESYESKDGTARLPIPLEYRLMNLVTELDGCEQ